MKYCVNSYAFGGYVNSLGIYGVIEKAVEYGFTGIEFTEADWYLNATDEELIKIGETARKAGLETVSLLVGGDMINGSNGDLDKEVEKACRTVDKAVLLGCKLMRHDAGHMPQGKKHGLGYAYNLARLAEGCRRVTEYAAERGVMTLAENHGVFSQDADRVASLIDAVDNPNFGALIDIGNFMDVDEDPTLSVSRLAPYAVHVHCKDVLRKPGTEVFPGEGWFQTRGGNYCRGTVVGHGMAGVSQCIRILKNNGYDGWLSVEYEGLEDNLLGIQLSLANLKRFWEMA